MATSALYLPRYAESRALIIGVDKYQNVSPLIHACNDAVAVAQLLISQFNFPKENVELLLDLDATREAITRAFLRYAKEDYVGPDDRILVFFAGHGHTVLGRRGEIGYLVPVDGRADELSSLIRWDELTRNAELISAKHVLFLMDACYSGLALKRAVIPPGSMRFLKNMLQRYARQVLTAGKADEAVADGGGTRAGHSIFTSHLLDGMEGAAAPNGGTITGYGLMAYVYDKVSSDLHSQQTPHFGFFDGDGDFIFDTSVLAALEPESSEPDPDIDVLIRAPTIEVPISPHPETTGETLKRLIGNPSEKIRLDDFISTLLRRASELLSLEKFPPHGAVTNEEFAARLEQYEAAISELQIAVILLARWAEPAQIKLLEKIFARVSDIEKANGGSVVWLRLAWYPLLALMYSAGISALSASRYDSLRASLLSPIYPGDIRAAQGNLPLVLPTVEELTEIVDQFKRLPDMERKYVPRSEYLFKKLQPLLEDELFLGRSYDALFDEFEIFLALCFGDLRDEDVSRHVWGPPGRFAWKERGRGGGNPVYSNFVSRAKSQGGEWPPLNVGFFKGSAQRFSDVADAYGQLLQRINWW